MQAGFAVVNQTDIQLQTFSLRYEAGRGAILEWELQRDGGEKGTLIVLRAQDAQPRAWHELTRLTLEERGFADDTVDVGSWAYALMLETKKSTHLLADDVILVGAPQPHLSLLGNRPNPFNPSTRIRFRLASAAPVDVRIFDLRGRLVRQLQATSPAGEGSIVWDGKDHAGRPQPSGTYIYEVIVEGGAAVARMTLLR